MFNYFIIFILLQNFLWFGNLDSLDREINKIKRKLNILKEFNFEFNSNPNNITSIKALEKILSKKIKKIMKKSNKSNNKKDKIIVQKIIAKQIKDFKGDVSYLNYTINKNNYFIYFISNNKIIINNNKFEKNYIYKINENKIIHSFFFNTIDSIHGIIIDSDYIIYKVILKFVGFDIKFEITNKTNLNSLIEVINKPLFWQNHKYLIIKNNENYYELDPNNYELIYKMKMKKNYIKAKKLLNGIYLVLYENKDLCLEKIDYDFKNCYKNENLKDFDIFERNVIILLENNELLLLNFNKESFIINNRCKINKNKNYNNINTLKDKIIINNEYNISFIFFNDLRDCKLKIKLIEIKKDYPNLKKNFFINNENILISIKLKDYNKISIHNFKKNFKTFENNNFFDLFNALKLPIIIITVWIIFCCSKKNNKNKMKLN